MNFSRNRNKILLKAFFSIDFDYLKTKASIRNLRKILHGQWASGRSRFDCKIMIIIHIWLHLNTIMAETYSRGGSFHGRTLQRGKELAASRSRPSGNDFNTNGLFQLLEYYCDFSYLLWSAHLWRRLSDYAWRRWWCRRRMFIVQSESWSTETYKNYSLTTQMLDCWFVVKVLGKKTYIAYEFWKECRRLRKKILENEEMKKIKKKNLIKSYKIFGKSSVLAIIHMMIRMTHFHLHFSLNCWRRQWPAITVIVFCGFPAALLNGWIFHDIWTLPIE